MRKKRDNNAAAKPGRATAAGVPADAAPTAGAARQAGTQAPTGALRIAMLERAQAARSEDFDRTAAACARLGFDALLLRAPLEAEPAAAGADAAPLQLERFASAAGAHGLRLLVDLRLDLFAGDAALVHEHPEWFRALRHHGEHLPDPRRPGPPPALVSARFEDPDCAEGLGEWWQARLGQWFEAGLAGVRCLEPQALPAARWQALVAGCRRRHGGAVFLAWTPGLPATDTAELAAAGFDAAFSSLPWWDFRQHWYFEEAARLQRFGSVIAPLAAAGSGSAEAADWQDETSARGARRRLEFAAASADGLLLPLSPADLDGDSVDDAQAQRREAIREANARCAGRAGSPSLMLRPLVVGETAASAMLLEPLDPNARAEASRLLLVNSDDGHLAPVACAQLVRAVGSFARFEALRPDDGSTLEPGGALVLEPAEVREYAARPARPVLLRRTRTTVHDAVQCPRIAIERVTPSVDDGRFVVKRCVGDVVEVEADIFSDGHEHLDAVVMWRPCGTRTWSQAPMRKLGNDRWRGEFPLERMGRHEFTVEAWRDRYGTLHAELEAKRGAGTLAAVDVQEACDLVSAAAARSRGQLAIRLRALERNLSDAADEDSRVALLLDPETAVLMARADDRPFLARGPVLPLDAERRAAGYASWYELFPRSTSGDPQRHGSFDDVIAQLPRIRDMGFDVLYMPPIHPIGRSHRKGRNNTLSAGPDEPGSPYAIGAEEGGHDAIHPQLGTLEDFLRLVEAAAAHGLEIALDFAIQCSPDHPWLREHPDWFSWRPDGTVRYAENPPKKYQDIVNVDFYAEGALPDLWVALRDVVRFWVQQGVKLFRVDNPHTKPYPFWEWLIDDIRARDPDVVFLSEAFTRPRPMYWLAKLGFSQSYTYFTWRNHKQELIDYMLELTRGEPRDFFRPHFFVNTPDINPTFLQTGGRPGHLIRAVLATTLSGLWGMYSGFELCEATPLAPGKEEYLDSEKFELRAWDWQRPGNIVAEISRLNLLRRLHPALQSHLGITFYNAFNDRILYYGKRAPGQRSMLLVAVNLDPYHAHEADFEVPLWEWQLPDHGALDVEDLWSGERFRWHGKVQHLRLDPHLLPFAIWRIQPAGGGA